MSFVHFQQMMLGSPQHQWHVVLRFWIIGQHFEDVSFGQCLKSFFGFHDRNGTMKSQHIQSVRGRRVGVPTHGGGSLVTLFNTSVVQTMIGVATSFQGGLPSCRMATTPKTRPEGDMSWREVGELGLRYARIPLALLVVEALYWFITMPSDTLAPIQVTEAYIWHAATNALFGEGSATLTTHNGWMTRLDLLHPTFPGPFSSVGLYVSDECAGVHEMLFLSTLVIMTDGVPQRKKIKTVAVMCGLVYILNIARLLVFYPIAVEGCTALPHQQACLRDMWQWHETVYQWGFLVVLVGMWLVWFIAYGGPSRTLKATQEANEPWRVRLRWSWQRQHFALIGAALVLFLLAFGNIATNEEAQEARATMEACEFANLLSSSCGSAQQRWDDAIGYAWSLSALGLLTVAGTGLVLERPLQDGTWPSTPAPVVVQEEPKPKGHHVKRSGSWKRHSREEE